MEIFIKKSVLRTDKSKIFNQKYWLKKVAPQLQEYPINKKTGITLEYLSFLLNNATRRRLFISLLSKLFVVVKHLKLLF